MHTDRRHSKLHEVTRKRQLYWSMGLRLYQVAILLTTALLSECDAKSLSLRRTSITGAKKSAEEQPRIADGRQEYGKSGQDSLKGHLSREVGNWFITTEVMRRLRKLGNLRKDFFICPKSNHRARKQTVVNFQNTEKVTDHANTARASIHRVRRRRYVLHWSKWSQSTITWNIPHGGWSTKLTNSQVNQTLSKAFRIWSAVAPLVFRWVDPPAEANITIIFATGSHGDTKPFDGPGKSLAHAFFPNDGGDIHFDDAESWTVSAIPPPGSKSFLSVAVHEIGHSLGLHHSTAFGSIMLSVYSVQNSNVILGQDDINGIQAKYGLCKTKVKAIESYMGDGRTYLFDSNVFWRLNDYRRQTDRGYPQRVSTEWSGVPDDIDEVFLWGHNWRTYFFKGSQYYKYNELYDRVDGGYPISISVGWPGVPDNIDAAFTFSDFISYFFKDDQVYKFDNSYDQVAQGYPLPISTIFPGVPNNIDSAFRWYYDGETYFFKNEYYYKWNSTAQHADGPFLIKLDWKNLCHV